MRSPQSLVRAAHGQIHEVNGLFQCVCAVSHDDAGYFFFLRRSLAFRASRSQIAGVMSEPEMFETCSTLTAHTSGGRHRGDEILSRQIGHIAALP